MPLVLSGTLTVENNPDAISSVMNPDGSTTTTIPVSGQLGSLGKFHGLWSESADAYGDYEGPDTVRIQNAKGAFTVAFNNENTHPSSAIAHGALSYEHAQHVVDGTGAFARASESGSIEVTTNPARTQVATLTLNPQHT